MSYNTRRGRGGNLNQNFVSGGQFQTAMKPGVQMGQRPPQQNQGYMQQQQQANKPTYQTSIPQQAQPLKSALKTTQQTFQPQIKQEVQKTPIKTQPVVTPQQQFTTQSQPQAQPQAPVPPVQMKEDMDITENTNGDNAEDVANEGKKKAPWNKFKTGVISSKISKKEKRGRRNQRLRKILQPKNALMVLNEIIGGQKYTVSEAPVAGDESFVATVTVESQDYVGNGKSKSAAKTAAAENALKSILLNKLRGSRSASVASLHQQTDGEGENTAMDVDTEKQQDEEDVSWLHVASYAIHKLFDSWDADGILNDSVGSTTDLTKTLATVGKPVTKKPAKALPSNAELMNPVMLLNQMRPGVVYEDFHKEGTSPNIQFTIRAMIDGLEFFGKGTNKKLARKNCALEACKKLFNISYPTEEVA